MDQTIPGGGTIGPGRLVVVRSNILHRCFWVFGSFTTHPPFGSREYLTPPTVIAEKSSTNPLNVIEALARHAQVNNVKETKHEFVFICPILTSNTSYDPAVWVCVYGFQIINICMASFGDFPSIQMFI